MKFIKRIVVYVTGLLFIAFGLVLSVNSKLGISPMNSLIYVISRIINIKLGMCVVTMSFSFILIQVLLLRKEFRWFNLTQMLVSVLFGYLIELIKWFMGDFSLPTYVGRLCMLVTSIPLISIGMCLYMDANLINMPLEAMYQTITEKVFKGISFHNVVIIIDCLAVFTAIVFSFLFLGRIEGIREGTILSAIFIGKVMKPVKKVLLNYKNTYMNV